jgi:RNA-directed DNA polymerase
VRYADDVTILVRSQRAGNRVMSSVTRWLGRVLKLEVNVEKSHVVPTDEATFLGFAFRRGKIRWSEKTLQRFRQRVRQLTNRNWGVSMKRRLRELSEYLRGWMAYFGLSAYYRPIPDLDSWIRRRVRMCYWIQWRRRFTRIQRLLALGVSTRWAVLTGLSSKGPWPMARNKSINMALSDERLAGKGLVSIRGLWIDLAALRRTA